VTGQDGSYLAEFLLHRGYEVHGIIRRASTFNTVRIEHIYQDPHVKESRLHLYYGDLAESGEISRIIKRAKPQEIFHLGAQSHVKVSFETPEYTSNITALGTLRILETMRENERKIRLYHASSSEMFGVSPPPQDESTPLQPRSPYAVAKAFSHWMATNYRDGYGLYISNGILFNHESPRRGETFLTRKVTRGIAGILGGKQKKIYLGNLESRRDWGFAPEYVEAIWRMMQLDSATDFVIGTGESHSVREFVEKALQYAGLPFEKHIEVDTRYFRPIEVEALRANSQKARRQIGWEPKIKFDDLVKVLVDADMRLAQLEPPGEGDSVLAKKFPIKWWVGD
jgi:GDPmannose 4,6-dehydratase